LRRTLTQGIELPVIELSLSDTFVGSKAEEAGGLGVIPSGNLRSTVAKREIDLSIDLT